MTNRKGLEFDTAKVYLDEAFDLFTRRYGEGHPYTGKVMTEYALLMQAQNKSSEGLTWIKKAALAFKKLGNEHPEAIQAAKILQELKSTPATAQPTKARANPSTTNGQGPQDGKCVIS